MKCLEKDRTRRYETVHGLARDIQRHLSDEPVLAGPPSARLSPAEVRPQAPHRRCFHGRRARRPLHRIGPHRDRLPACRAAAAVGCPGARPGSENLGLARHLVSDVIRPAAVRMSNFPYAQAYQFEVLQQARTFYQKILQQAETIPKTRREMALIHYSRESWHATPAAMPSRTLPKSVSMLEDLVTESPDNPDSSSIWPMRGRGCRSGIRPT